MTTGFGYALGAMLLFGTSDLIYKRAAAAGVAPHHMLMVQSWVFTPTVILYGLATGTLVFVPGTLWGGLTGLFVWIGFYNFAYSLRLGAVTVNAPIFRLSFVITAALAMLLLGEPATAGKLAGIVLALLAVWLLLAAPGVRRGAVAAPAAGPHPIARRERRAALVRVLLATACVGIGNLIYKYGLHDHATPASLVVAQAAIVVTFSTLFAGVADRGIRPLRVTWLYAPGAAVILAAAFACMVESLARGDASVMVPIAQMGMAVTAVLGFVFLREPFTLRKGAGLLAALAALASFAIL